MSSRFHRFRGYADELAELLQMVGRELADARAELDETWERPRWRRYQREALEGELLRLALDTPFFRELVETAWRHGPDELALPPGEVHPWSEGREHKALLSAERAEGRLVEATQREPRDGRRAEVELAGGGRAEAGSSSPAWEDAPRSADAAEELPEGPPPAPARLRSAERALAGRSRSIVLVLENLQSPRNASAILRSAEALGVMELHFVQEEGGVILRRTVTRRCQHFVDLHFARRVEPTLESLKERGYRLLAMDFGEGARPVEEVPITERVALIVGSEQLGVSRAARELAEGSFYLPTSGFTAYLNASVAAALGMASIDRRQREAGLRLPLDETEKHALRAAWYERLAPNARALPLYRRFVDDPPPPAPSSRATPSREKAREAEET